MRPYATITVCSLVTMRVRGARCMDGPDAVVGLRSTVPGRADGERQAHTGRVTLHVGDQLMCQHARQQALLQARHNTDQMDCTHSWPECPFTRPVYTTSHLSTALPPPESRIQSFYSILLPYIGHDTLRHNV